MKKNYKETDEREEKTIINYRLVSISGKTLKCKFSAIRCLYRKNYSKMTVTELKDECNKRGMIGFSKLKKIWINWKIKN